MTRSGFVALAGRPNVGKSTLVNMLVGHKVAIVSDKPQTTRRAIRGVATAGEHQLVLVDLPGVQRPRDALTERMQRRVERELADSDAALFVLNGEEGAGPGDRFIASALRRAGLLPEGPYLFPPDERSDQPEDVLIAELVREQVLRRTFQEVPHAVEVVIDDLAQPRDDLTLVRALVWVEAESQKGILIGAGGRMIKAVGTAARKELERELGTRVHLDLSVRVRRGWRGDEALLDRLGID